MSDLRVLGELILDSIETIESRFSHEDIDFPALANPFNGECKAESILLEPEISTARSYIVAAASQLIAMVRSPVQTMVENGLVVRSSSARLSVQIEGFNKFHYATSTKLHLINLHQMHHIHGPHTPSLRPGQILTLREKATNPSLVLHACAAVCNSEYRRPGRNQI
jgi:hypothetical protein